MADFNYIGVGDEGIGIILRGFGIGGFNNNRIGQEIAIKLVRQPAQPIIPLDDIFLWFRYRSWGRGGGVGRSG